MKRAVYAFSAALVLAHLGMASARAQTAPSVDRLTPLQRQQISRDLVPSSSQDFFNAGQANLEQEIHRLTRQRSSNENLLKVSQGAQLPPDAYDEKAVPLHHDRTQ